MTYGRVNASDTLVRGRERGILKDKRDDWVLVKFVFQDKSGQWVKFYPNLMIHINTETMYMSGKTINKLKKEYVYNDESRLIYIRFIASLDLSCYYRKC